MAQAPRYQSSPVSVSANIADAGAGYDAAANSLQFTAQVLDKVGARQTARLADEAKLSGSLAGAKDAVQYDANGLLKPLSALPDGSNIYSQAYRAAAVENYRAAAQVDFAGQADKLARENVDNPAGFLKAWNEYTAASVNGAQPELQPHFAVDLHEIGGKAYSAIADAKATKDIEAAAVNLDLQGEDTLAKAEADMAAAPGERAAVVLTETMAKLTDLRRRRNAVKPYTAEQIMTSEKEARVRLASAYVVPQAVAAAKSGGDGAFYANSADAKGFDAWAGTATEWETGVPGGRDIASMGPKAAGDNGALGYFQFRKETFESLGGDWEKLKAHGYSFDEQKAYYKTLVVSNAGDFTRKFNSTPNDSQLFMFSIFGSPAGSKLLLNLDADATKVVGENAINANRSMITPAGHDASQPLTGRDILEAIGAKFGNGYTWTGQGAPASHLDEDAAVSFGQEAVKALGVSTPSEAKSVMDAVNTAVNTEKSRIAQAVKKEGEDNTLMVSLRGNEAETFLELNKDNPKALLDQLGEVSKQMENPDPELWGTDRDAARKAIGLHKQKLITALNQASIRQNGANADLIANDIQNRLVQSAAAGDAAGYQQALKDRRLFISEQVPTPAKGVAGRMGAVEVGASDFSRLDPGKKTSIINRLADAVMTTTPQLQASLDKAGDMQSIHDGLLPLTPQDLKAYTKWERGLLEAWGRKQGVYVVDGNGAAVNGPDGQPQVDMQALTNIGTEAGQALWRKEFSRTNVPLSPTFVSNTSTMLKDALLPPGMPNDPQSAGINKRRNDAAHALVQLSALVDDPVQQPRIAAALGNQMQMVMTFKNLLTANEDPMVALDKMRSMQGKDMQVAIDSNNARPAEAFGGIAFTKSGPDGPATDPTAQGNFKKWLQDGLLVTQGVSGLGHEIGSHLREGIDPDAPVMIDRYTKQRGWLNLFGSVKELDMPAEFVDAAKAKYDYYRALNANTPEADIRNMVLGELSGTWRVNTLTPRGMNPQITRGTPEMVMRDETGRPLTEQAIKTRMTYRLYSQLESIVPKSQRTAALDYAERMVNSGLVGLVQVSPGQYNLVANIRVDHPLGDGVDMFNYIKYAGGHDPESFSAWIDQNTWMPGQHFRTPLTVAQNVDLSNGKMPDFAFEQLQREFNALGHFNGPNQMGSDIAASWLDVGKNLLGMFPGGLHGDTLAMQDVANIMSHWAEVDAGGKGNLTPGMPGEPTVKAGHPVVKPGFRAGIGRSGVSPQ